VRTGLPFGSYDYTGTLGAEILGVPLVVPLAWTMMAYPALLVARRLAAGRVAVAVVGAWALTAWDVFLDPQMVDAGHWTWAHPRPSLPGVDGIPLSNFAGWFLVSLVLLAVLDRVLGDAPGDPRVQTRRLGGTGRVQTRRLGGGQRVQTRRVGRFGGFGGFDGDLVPLAVYLWTYVSSVMAHALFFGRPSVALVGAVVMGVVAVPLGTALLRPALARRRAGR
jgi:hypothetical protein